MYPVPYVPKGPLCTQKILQNIFRAIGPLCTQNYYMYGPKFSRFWSGEKWEKKLINLIKVRLKQVA